MTANEAVVAVIDALHAAGVPFMLVGAYSCNVYGVPRSTKDADFVVELRPDSISKICAQFDDRFRLDPQMSFESVTATSRHIIHVKNSPFRIELFCLSDDPHDRERFGRRRASRTWDRDVFYPTAEDVIITKVRWSHYLHRSKDADDVRNVIATQGQRLDWEYIRHWCDKHGTRDLLDELRASIPDMD